MLFRRGAFRWRRAEDRGAWPGQGRSRCCLTAHWLGSIYVSQKQSHWGKRLAWLVPRHRIMQLIVRPRRRFSRCLGKRFSQRNLGRRPNSDGLFAPSAHELLFACKTCRNLASGSRARAEGEEMRRGFVEILAQTVKRPLSENELGAALSLAF
jgi:hypothetical protein